MSRFIDFYLNPRSVPSAVGAFVGGTIIFFLMLAIFSNFLVVALSFLIWEWTGFIGVWGFYRIVVFISVVLGILFAKAIYKGEA